MFQSEVHFTSDKSTRVFLTSDKSTRVFDRPPPANDTGIIYPVAKRPLMQQFIVVYINNKNYNKKWQGRTYLQPN